MPPLPSSRLFPPMSEDTALSSFIGEDTPDEYVGFQDEPVNMATLSARVDQLQQTNDQILSIVTGLGTSVEWITTQAFEVFKTMQGSPLMKMIGRG